MNFDKKQLRNTLLLLLGALIWGTAFVAQSVGSGYVCLLYTSPSPRD